MTAHPFGSYVPPEPSASRYKAFRANPVCCLCGEKIDEPRLSGVVNGRVAHTTNRVVNGLRVNCFLVSLNRARHEEKKRHNLEKVADILPRAIAARLRILK